MLINIKRNFVSMKSLFIFVYILVSSFAASFNCSAAACRLPLECFEVVGKRFTSIENDLKTWVDLQVEKISKGTRWRDGMDKHVEATLDIKRSLGKAESLAAANGKVLGYNVANAQITLVNSSVINSVRTSLEEAGEAVGKVIKRSDLDDQTLGECLLGSEKCMYLNSSVKKTFDDNKYTSAEFLKDLGRVIDDDPPCVIGPDMWAFNQKLRNPGGDPGAIAEIAVAARLKRQYSTPIHIGADEILGSPLHNAAVDILTDNKMYQVGLTSETIRSKIYANNNLGPQIKKAMQAYPSKPYKFIYTHGDSLSSTAIDDLNLKLRAAFDPSSPPYEFTADDFIKIPINVD